MASLHTLNRRLMALEEQFGTANTIVPTFLIIMERGNPAKPYSIENDGETWTQGPDESLDDFKARAVAGAALQPIPKGRHPVRMLLATRPRFTKDEWLAVYGPDSKEPWSEQ
jgi:hypothetical protein